MLLLLCALASAAAPPADPALARLSGPLREAVRALDEGRLDAWRYRREVPDDAAGLSVVVHAEGDPDALRAELDAAGLPVEAASGDAVQVWVAWDDLRALAALPGVARVREPWRASPKAMSEGYDAIMLQDWHTSGLTGAGVSVAVVDVGFAGLDDVVAAGELPADVVSDFSRGDATSTDHGVAVAEVIADFAPDASLRLASFSTDVEFGELLADLTDQKVDVINGSIGFDNVWHADGTSSLTVYADRAVDDGAIYVAAAGNENDKYRVGALTYAEGGEIAIAGEAGVWCLTSGGFAQVSFRWSEPFLAAKEDIDLVVYNRDGSECGRSEDSQDGDGWPYELVEAEGCSSEVRAVPYSRTADVAGLEGYLYGYAGIDEAAWTNTEDLTLPGDTVEGVSVGAVYIGDDAVTWYSSRGPTNDGRTKPDVVAPTGVTTLTYGRHHFDGTSAAAPHVAGVAALWTEATKGRDKPREFTAWLQDGALDLAPAGPDNASGAGLVQVTDIPEPGCGCGVAPGGWPGWVGMAAAAAWIRRRSR